MGRPVQPERTETYGLPESLPHLIQKLRQLDPDLLAQLLKDKP